MSLSYELKSELCSRPPESEDAARAEFYGVLLLANKFDADGAAVITANPRIAARVRELAGISFGIGVRETAGARMMLRLGGAETARVRDFYGASENRVAAHINRAAFEDELIPDFLRGAFLTGGAMSESHLEFETPRAALSRELRVLLAECGLPPKTLMRGGNHLLYYKSSERIEDFCVLTGATDFAMRLMDMKIERELRNKANREANCDAANAGRTASAAAELIPKLERLMRGADWDALPENLRQTALSRVAHPEEPLAELARRLGMSKSGLNHRLKKLSEL